MIPLNLVFEDELSEFAMTRLVNSFGDKYHIGNTYPGRGNAYIKTNINGFNEAAITAPFFVLTDLDRANCAPELIDEWLGKPKRNNLIFRVAVREVESWILSDREGFSAYTGVSVTNIPLIPENESDPKRTLINVVRRSRKRALKEDILPMNENASIGPNYNGRLMEFVMEKWNFNRAAERSDSLSRTIRCLRDFRYRRTD